MKTINTWYFPNCTDQQNEINMSFILHRELSVFFPISLFFFGFLIIIWYIRCKAVVESKKILHCQLPEGEGD